MHTLASLARIHRSRARAVQDVLEACLEEESFFAQLSAAKALGKLGRASATAALERVMERDTDGRIRKAARRALDQLTRQETPEAWKALRQEVDGLRKDNRDLRQRLERLEGQLLPRPGSTPTHRSRTTRKTQSAARKRAR